MKLNLIRSLLTKRKSRLEQRKLILEGPRLIEEGIDLIDFAVYCQDYPVLANLQSKGVECHKINPKEFEELSQVETPQGILAVARQPEYQLADMLKTDNPLIVFCHEIQDPGNLGTIIRTADAAGATGVILSKGTVELYNPKVVRSTMGSLFHLPIVEVEDSWETIEQLKEQGIKVFATSLDQSSSLYAVDLKKPSAVILGNEGAGLPQEVVKLADQTIKIPISGQAESLNVAVSAAIVLYEALRQRTTFV